MRYGCKIKVRWLVRWLASMLILALLWPAALGKECKDESTWCQEEKDKKGCRAYPASERYLRNCMVACNICDPLLKEFTCTEGYYRSGDTCRPCRYPDDNAKCNDTCPLGRHGRHCNLTCGNCLESGCQRWSGQCHHGCQEGWVGVECKGLDPTGRFYITFDLLAVSTSCLLAGTIILTGTTVAIVVTLKRRCSCCVKRGRKNFSPLPLPIMRTSLAEDEEPLYDQARLPPPRYTPRKPRPHLFNRVPVGHLPYIRRSISVDDLTYLSSRTLRFSQQPSFFERGNTSDLGTSNGSEDAMHLEPSPYVVYFSRRTRGGREGGREGETGTMKVEPSPVVIYMSRRAAGQMADRDNLRLDGIRSFDGYMDMSGTEIPRFLPWRLWPARDAVMDEGVSEDGQEGSGSADSGLGCPDGNFTIDLIDDVPLPVRVSKRGGACALM